jgi:vacuolar protein sorting-associated protein 13A/C
MDSSKGQTFYRKIAESMDEKVFDAKVILYDHDVSEKAKNVNLVDIAIEAKMGRIKLVFLMKFVNDLLAFIEPFSGAKDIMAEKASDALEGATKTMIDAYANSTRAQLKIQMDAPLIIIPVSSKDKVRKSLCPSAFA